MFVFSGTCCEKPALNPQFLPNELGSTLHRSSIKAFLCNKQIVLDNFKCTFKENNEAHFFLEFMMERKKLGPTSSEINLYRLNQHAQVRAHRCPMKMEERSGRRRELRTLGESLCFDTELIMYLISNFVSISSVDRPNLLGPRLSLRYDSFVIVCTRPRERKRIELVIWRPFRISLEMEHRA